ncbi:cytidylate kinase [Hasllibacter halocynthiae]|uniref:Cytidylate kinase n=1 Tax=Hasllibacter halocynthiae TaxID=595589 RepID=A0A2T0X4D4_9RHOB|nr:(d)CMP kinase [Hasllibacter halocynthiae]PRY93765.1 cytidylate kinase [Hasllibacter halocynthiae]
MIDGPFTVAIDGPAAAGKGTVSRALAERFGMAHLDTGLLYRAVAAQALAGADPVAAATSLMMAELERADLRTPEVAQEASRVAADPEVRRALVGFQRRIARQAGGAVLDGRDICTVIAPEAEVKLFVTASAERRAERRFEELRARGVETTLEEVVGDVRARDERDARRRDAPMVRAEDAEVVDTTAMTIEEAVEAASGFVERALAAR